MKIFANLVLGRISYETQCYPSWLEAEIADDPQPHRLSRQFLLCSFDDPYNDALVPDDLPMDIPTIDK